MNPKVVYDAVVAPVFVEPGVLDVVTLARLLDIPYEDLHRILPYFYSTPHTEQILRTCELVIEAACQSEPNLSIDEYRNKMQSWLHLSQPSFGHKTPIELILSRKTRQLIHYLEQICS